MVSMLPNSQLYDLTYKYDNSPFCNPRPAKKEEDSGTIYDVLKKDKNFSKTVAIIDKSGLKQNYSYSSSDRSQLQYGLTLFVTDDSKISDTFLSHADRFVSGVFIKSYTIPGVANIDYLVSNNTTLYTTKSNDNPILCVLKESVVSNRRHVELIINDVGRVVREISTTNGHIIVLDNIASNTYVN